MINSTKERRAFQCMVIKVPVTLYRQHRVLEEERGLLLTPECQPLA